MAQGLKGPSSKGEGEFSSSCIAFSNLASKSHSITHCVPSVTNLPIFKGRVHTLYLLKEERKDSGRVCWTRNIVAAIFVKHSWSHSSRELFYVDRRLG